MRTAEFGGCFCLCVFKAGTRKASSGDSLNVEPGAMGHEWYLAGSGLLFNFLVRKRFARQFDHLNEV